MLSAISEEILIDLNNNKKISQNIISYFEETLLKINEMIQIFNEGYTNYNNPNRQPGFLKSWFKKKSELPASINNMLFQLRKLEIFVEDVLNKFIFLEKKLEITIGAQQKKILQIAKKDIIDIELQLAYNESKSINQLVMEYFTNANFSSIENKNIFKSNDKTKLMQDFQTGTETFCTHLAKYVLQKDGNNELLPILYDDVVFLNLLFEKEELKTFISSKKIFEKIRYILSQKQYNDFKKLEDSIIDETNGLLSDNAKIKIAEIFTNWLDINDPLVNINCISNNNNLIIQIAYDNEYPFTFMRSKMLPENEFAIFQLQQSTAKEYLAQELNVMSYTPEDENEKYRYNLIPWFPNSSFENFAVNIMASEKLTLEKKQAKIFIAITKIIAVILFFRDQKVIDPDIKPSNFLIGNNSKRDACLGDWKTLFIHDISEGKKIKWNKMINSPSYRPPEQYGDNYYATDMCEDFDRFQTFMVGISLYQMMHGWDAATLEANLPKTNSIFYNENGCILSFDPENFQGTLGKIAKILIKNMLQPEYNKRPMLQEVFDVINLSLSKAQKIDEEELDNFESMEQLTELFMDYKNNKLLMLLEEEFCQGMSIEEINADPFDLSIKNNNDIETTNWKMAQQYDRKKKNLFIVGCGRRNYNNNTNKQIIDEPTEKPGWLSWAKSGADGIIQKSQFFLVRGNHKNNNNNNAMQKSDDATELPKQADDVNPYDLNS